MFFIVKQTANYADEFDTDGFMLFTYKELKDFKEHFDNAIYPLEIGFGSNEGIRFETIEDYKDSFTIKEITESQYDFLIETFEQAYGMFIADY